MTSATISNHFKPVMNRPPPPKIRAKIKSSTTSHICVSLRMVHSRCRPGNKSHVPTEVREESGMRIRAATDADIEQIVALQVDRNGAECDAEVRALMADPQMGSGRFTVAEENGRVASSLSLIPETLVMEGVAIPTGQPEFVATLPEYEGRGLV